MKSAPVSSITIVGGGSSGWMTAIYLNRLYNQHNKQVHIRVIESEDVGIIGVGEATVHSVRFFFAAMGLSEQELLKETNATLKSGILFRNWMKPTSEGMHEYFHPFESIPAMGTMDLATAWLADQQGMTFDEAASISLALNNADKCPKATGNSEYQGLVNYAYHLDATLMARFLRRKACEAGVEHVVANVTHVETQNNKITDIQTDKGCYQADLFIDCTGFRGLLVNALKQDNWTSYEQELPCNRAVAIQREYAPGQSPSAFTKATALNHGWAWEIDLCHRQGTGYVYDGRTLTPEQAEAELKAHLGNEQEIVKVTHLKMNIGRRNEFFVGNCVAVGLAGGFIEPLESTGLHLINLGVRLLATHLVSGEIPQSVKDSYNKKMTGFYEDLRQFIVLHYCLTDRRDTDFWRQAAESAKYIPGLEQKIQLWQHKACENLDLESGYGTIFTADNYRYVLYGMGHTCPLSLPFGHDDVRQPLEIFKTRKQQILAQALDHKTFLKLD